MGDWRIGKEVQYPTPEEYELLLKYQDGKCGICRAKPRTRKLAVDHDHVTGNIRGLLCSRCNHDLLGKAHDDVVLLERAIDYLQSPPGYRALRTGHGGLETRLQNPEHKAEA